MSLLSLKKSCDIKVNEDSRGCLTAVDNVPEFTVKRFYIIDCLKDMWRGNHYHKTTTQMITLISGVLSVETLLYRSHQDTNDIIETQSFQMLPGDVFVQKAFIKFRFKSLTDSSRLLVICDTYHDQSDYYVE